MSTYSSLLYLNSQIEDAIEPDKIKHVSGQVSQPKSNTVLCCNEKGEATAIYGMNNWNLAPISINDEGSQFNFDLSFSDSFKKEHPRQVIEHTMNIKWFLFIIMYFAYGGKLGVVSVGTLKTRFNTLISIALFCEKLGESKLMSGVTITDIITKEVYLARYIETLSEGKKRYLYHLFSSLHSIKREFLGFKPIDFTHSSIQKNKQTPLIPTRIYFGYFSKLTQQTNYFWENKDKLTNFISEFNHPNVGYSKGYQKSNIKDLGMKNGWQLTCNELLEKYDFINFMPVQENQYGKHNIVGFLADIQLTMIHTIHLYTGMRKSEVLRTKYNCVRPIEVTPRVSTDYGEVSARFIDVLSTTTKFCGYLQEVSWLAPDIVRKAIEVLQSISKGIAILHDLKPEDLPLCISTRKITHRADKPTKANSASNKPRCLNGFVISNEDYKELLASDVERTFDEQEFKIGNVWNVNKHQYRRALAFYGANSDLISVETGAEQFKHLGREMQTYYRRGFNKLTTIFGFYNKSTGQFELPNDHFMFEFQTGISTDNARQIIEVLFENSHDVFGKTGSYIERQRKNLKENEVKILYVKKNTEKKSANGELCYKKTLYGGCMKDDKCDSYMLGSLTACLGCDDAIIDLDKVDEQILELEKEIDCYQLGTGEYQLVHEELNRLRNFKKSEIKKSK